MPVVLTGDVHHYIPSSDRRHAVESESALAVEYARIAERHGLKVTLFFTGRALRDNVADARPLLSMQSVEIGGHGWDAFTPKWVYRPLARLSGSPQGYPTWQRRSIARTCAAVESFAAEPPRSWRNHAYAHDSSTPALLADAGIVAWSDEVDLERTRPYTHETGLVVLPINTLPDHENLYHGDRTPETLGETPCFYPAEWRERVLEAVEGTLAQGGVATVLAHPLCMKVVDGWETFEMLCSGLAGRPSMFATEAADAVRDRSR
jgi:peptidoglycan/xylan/chitin deacetylase (PgdA/CDA1 family)